MRTNRRRRFERVRDAMGCMPYRARVMGAAFECFRQTGVLPDDDDRLVEALLDRARCGGAANARQLSKLERLLMRVDTGVPGPGTPRGESVRDHLFEEATHDVPFAREAARGAIRVLVSLGGDVCSPAFGADKGLPTHGTVGMHVLDLPKNLGMPPYEERARRLFRRMDELRQRIDYRTPGWWDPIEEALVAFRDEGTPPPEGLVGDWVYALAEYDGLWRHRNGEDVAERMASLDALASGPGHTL